MQEGNYYEILEIDNSAESQTIHIAYKRLSKEYQQNELTLYDYILKMHMTFDKSMTMSRNTLPFLRHLAFDKNMRNF